uniref:Two pore potassium channel protein sup-9 n=1 Tax=Cacopsylla melanoneura TaxID=428564 RepID=A0A8D8X4P7_9HEMI
MQSYQSSVSSLESNPREKIKDCCRKLVAFMCTQVGVGGLIVGYAVVGAFVFSHIETAEERPQLALVANLTNYTITNLWFITEKENIMNKTSWKLASDKVLLEYQKNMTQYIKAGYDGRTVKQIWSFPAALMFSLSIFTMIGYGNMVPRTTLGKATTVVYAVFGIPLYILYFRNMGKVLAQCFRWVYTWLYECTMEDRLPDGAGPPPRSRIIVPSTACLWVLGGYVATGTVMFSSWEEWPILDSCYFCVTSLCKIGIGDFVPKARDMDSKIVMNFIYILLGMGLIAMCYDLMREDVRVKVRNLKMEIGFCFEVIRMRAIACYRQRSIDDD